MKRIESFPALVRALRKRRFALVLLFLLLAHWPTAAGAAADVQQRANPLVELDPLAWIIPFDPALYQKVNGPEAGDGFTVMWAGISPPGTSITSFDIQVKKPGDISWNDWLTGVTTTSAFFALDLADPDGEYAFRARATNSDGIVGPYLDESFEVIIVDRFEPLAAGLLTFAGGGQESTAVILSGIFVLLMMASIFFVWVLPFALRKLGVSSILTNDP